MSAYYNGSNNPSGPSNRKTGEQYLWASFLPYTVEFRGDQWCTWTIIALWSAVAYGVFNAFAGAIMTFDNMGLIIFLVFLLSVVICGSAALATFQLYKSRSEAYHSGLDPKTAAPRGWVLSIILTLIGALSVLTWGAAVLTMMG
ncbi:hypothetical protein [Bifidobacterium jacchi]|uniref:Uncharacterized protein n=1 Tax=Bifidobacterium jacchi TaxID=2490545 RepID=A0A5N5RK32_9BIFI|nr:hypothetical protein [Bifidobacterium jacchi]KAB5607646.1 hypothetical protein EHS19_04090 [Bifidobacterium jacchi]